MMFTNFLKEQLTDFIESYKKYFQQTYIIAITLTVLCFVIAALLFRFSDFAKPATKQISLLSYFFSRFSKLNTYSIIDLTKTEFIFFVSLFSIGLLRLPKGDIGPKEITFKDFFRSISIKDVLFLIATLIFSSVIDFILFKIDSISLLNITSENVAIYIHDTCFHLRIYIPLVLFALTILTLTGTENKKLSLCKVLLLYISLWLFNEFAFEISSWVRVHVFGLVLMPFTNPEHYYLMESIIGIPLIAFYFLGYFSAMTTSLRLMEPALPE